MNENKLPPNIMEMLFPQQAPMGGSPMQMQDQMQMQPQMQSEGMDLMQMLQSLPPEVIQQLMSQQPQPQQSVGDTMFGGGY